MWPPFVQSEAPLASLLGMPQPFSLYSIALRSKGTETGERAMEETAMGATAMGATGAGTLTDAQRSLLETIVRGKRPWTAAADLVRGGPAEDLLASLEGTGYLARWDVPEGLAWPDEAGPIRVLTAGRHYTLTPWGAAALGVVLVEHWEYETVVEQHFAGPRKPSERVCVRRAVELPRWGDAEQERDRERRRVPLKIPPRARMQALTFPDRVADPALGPDLLLDESSGAPVTLCGGYPITIDPRLARRPKSKPKPRRRLR
jgi:hypothetical protein